MLDPLDLLHPQPRRVRQLSGETALDKGCRIVTSTGADSAAEALERSLRALELAPCLGGPGTGPSRPQLRLALDDEEPLGPQGYRMTCEADGVDIIAASPTGLFYGGQTLEQWLRVAGRREGDRWLVPRLEVADAPDLEQRGFLLDVSRNRVPRLDSLFELVELLASFKLNQLQLYTEHTFAYRGHETVWRNASPFTDSDIRELDAHCRRHFVELVPNQNCFGHLHRWLSHDAYRQLAERPDGVEHPFGREREPFSLNPVDPRSVEFVEDLLDQLLPHFSSRQVNVGLDETFDLGTGGSADACRERGKEEVYLEFLLKIHELVGRWGHRMQFWGDILLTRPDLVRRLPRDVVALNWGYEADHPFEEEARTFSTAGLEYYLCPGTSSWNSLGGRIKNAVGNLGTAAIAASRHGATGYLITDWGDNGHLQPLPISYPALLAGAGFSWRTEEAERAAELPLHDLLAAHVRELQNPATVAALMILGTAHEETGVTLKNSTVLFHLLTSTDETLENERYERLSVAGLADAQQRLESIDLPSSRGPADRELAWVTDALTLACRIGRARLSIERNQPARALPKVEREPLVSAASRLIADLPELWLSRSRPGGLDESLAVLERTRAALT